MSIYFPNKISTRHEETSKPGRDHWITSECTPIRTIWPYVNRQPTLNPPPPLPTASLTDVQLLLLFTHVHRQLCRQSRYGWPHLFTGPPRAPLFGGWPVVIFYVIGEGLKNRSRDSPGGVLSIMRVHLFPPPYLNFLPGCLVLRSLSVISTSST